MQLDACWFWILWFVLYYFPFRCHPHVFCVVALLFLWCCVAFVFCMLSSSDLLWPPSAREHSADPSGKHCTLDSLCDPFPASPFFTLPGHKGCTILAKMTFLIFPSHPVHQVNIFLALWRSNNADWITNNYPQSEMSQPWNIEKGCVWVCIQMHVLISCKPTLKHKRSDKLPRQPSSFLLSSIYSDILPDLSKDEPQMISGMLMLAEVFSHWPGPLTWALPQLHRAS